MRATVEPLERRRLLASVQTVQFLPSGTRPYIDVTFDETTSVSHTAFHVQNLTQDIDVAAVPMNFSNEQVTNRWALPTPLATGWYETYMRDREALDADEYENTFSFLAADFDSSQSVDFNDFMILQNHFGQDFTTFAQGDANYDETVDFNDYLILQNSFGQTLRALSSEPGSVSVANTSPGTLTVGWTADANFRRGFKIYRSSDWGDTYTLVKTIADPEARTWTDGGPDGSPLTLGATYWYRVRAYTAAGVSASVRKASGVPNDSINPATNLMAVGTGPGQIGLTWTPSDDPRVTGYRVYRSQTQNFSPSAANLVTTTAASAAAFSDSGLTPGQTYYYTVVAAGAGSAASVPSLQVSGVAQADASSRFQASFKFGKDNAAVLPGYIADIGNGYREGSSGYAFGWLDAASGAPAKAGAQHDFDPVNPSLIDSSINTYGINGPVSWEVSVPNGTYFVKLVAGDQRVNSGLYKYGVENDTSFLDGVASSGVQWITAEKTVTVYDGHLTIFNVSGADNHAIAYVEITDAAGKLRNAVDAPLNVAATAAASNKIDVRWTDASDNETGFRIDRAATPNGSWIQVGMVTANAAVFTDTVTPGRGYVYRVGAVKGALLGRAVSNAITTPATSGRMPYNASRTSWPTGTAIQAEDFDAGGDGITYDDVINGNAGGFYRNSNVDVGYHIPGDRYFVGWTRDSEWMEYTVNVTEPGTYVLEASVASEGDGGSLGIKVNDAAVTLAAGTTPAAIDIPDTGGFTNYQQVVSQAFTLAAGTNQRLRLTATESGISPLFVGDVDWLKLKRLDDSAVHLTATAPNKSEANLSWNDPFNDETGYRIEKSSDGVNFVGLQTLPPNATGWSVIGLTGNHHYQFRVVALFADTAAENSNPAGVTTPTPASSPVLGTVTPDIHGPIKSYFGTYPAGTYVVRYTGGGLDYGGDDPATWRASYDDDKFGYKISFPNGEQPANATFGPYPSIAALEAANIGKTSVITTTATGLIGMHLADDVFYGDIDGTGPIRANNGPGATFQLESVSVPIVSITSTDAEAWETPTGSQDNALTFTVTRTGGDLGQPLNVYLHPAAGTATAADFAPGIPSLLHFNAGQSSASFIVHANAEGLIENDETVAICLKAATQYRLGASFNTVATIHDSNITDVNSVVTITVDKSSVTESSNDRAVFKVTRTGGDQTQPLVVSFALSDVAIDGRNNATDGDYNLYLHDSGTTPLAGNTIIINPSSAEAKFSLVPKDDTLDEGNGETAVVALTSGSYTLGTPSTANTLIADDDGDDSTAVHHIVSPVGNADGSPLEINFDTPVQIKSYNIDGGSTPWAVWLKPIDVAGDDTRGDPVLLASGLESAGDAETPVQAALVGPSWQGNGQYEILITASAQSPANPIESRAIRIVGASLTLGAMSSRWTTLSWQARSNSSQYVVFRDSIPNFEASSLNCVGVSTNPAYDDVGVAPNTTYYYQVFSVSANGTKDVIGRGSVRTPEESAGAAALGAVNAASGEFHYPTISPSNVAALGVNDLEIFVSWDVSPSTHISKYQVDVSTDQATWFHAATASPLDTSAFVRGIGPHGENFLQRGVNYYVRVSAVADNWAAEGFGEGASGGGQSPWSTVGYAVNVREPDVVVTGGNNMIAIIGGNLYPAHDLLKGIKVQNGHLVGATNANSMGAIWARDVEAGYNAFITPDPYDGGAPQPSNGRGPFPPGSDSTNIILTNNGSGRLYEEMFEEFSRGITNIGLIGYSHGGGMVYNISERLRTDPDLPLFARVVFAGTVDAVAYGTGPDAFPNEGWYKRYPEAGSPAQMWDCAGKNYYELNGWMPGGVFSTNNMVNAQVHGQALNNADNFNFGYSLDHSSIAVNSGVLQGINTATDEAFDSLSF